MTEREQKIDKFIPFLYFEYKSVIKGVNDTDYPSERKYQEYSGPRLVVVANNTKIPKVMVKRDFNRALKQMIWVNDGELRLFWKLEPDRDCDFVVRDVRKDTIYHYGRNLYLKSKLGEKEVEVAQIGFGYGYFGIHYLKKASLKEHGVVDYGNLTKEILTKFLSSK